MPDLLDHITRHTSLRKVLIHLEIQAHNPDEPPSATLPLSDAALAPFR